jgi:hypothetical protein
MDGQTMLFILMKWATWFIFQITNIFGNLDDNGQQQIDTQMDLIRMTLSSRFSWIITDITYTTKTTTTQPFS